MHLVSQSVKTFFLFRIQSDQKPTPLLPFLLVMAMRVLFWSKSIYMLTFFFSRLLPKSRLVPLIFFLRGKMVINSYEDNVYVRLRLWNLLIFLSCLLTCAFVVYLKQTNGSSDESKLNKISRRQCKVLKSKWRRKMNKKSRRQEVYDDVTIYTRATK